MTIRQTDALPQWDMSVVYSGLESPEFEQGFQLVVRAIAELEVLFNQHAIGRREVQPLDQVDVQAFEMVVTQLNELLDQVNTLRAYIHSFISTDSRNTVAQARMSALQRDMVKFSLLSTRFTAWIGSLDIDALLERSQVARDHDYMIEKAKIRAGHLMEPAQEELAAELNITGGTAWSKLYSTFSSQLMVPIGLKGEAKELPMSAIRNLAFDPDRETRRVAYEAELAAWQRAAVPIAAAMNSIKGEVNTLAKRRGWEQPLDIGVFDNNIDRQTLDAMMQAAHESFPDFRRYLRAKAKALGLPALAWYDLFAPVGSSAGEWDYSDAIAFITTHFGAFSPRLRELAERAFGENWIDAEPRAGKVGGAFCMKLRGDESRILTNYKPSFGGVSTLAHELGHAYHNMNLAGRAPLQRTTPMTLAETASIFCETIVVQAALKQASREEQIQILEASLQDSCQVVVDITSRFLFEQQVLDARQQRELSADEFCALMREAQTQTYGDGLDQTMLHPYMWAAKPHYYSSLFYNYPYMFGLLFGLGLYARYQSDPDSFKGVYDDLLSSTGLGDAASLAMRFGIDIHSVDFWRSSLDVIRGHISQFEQLVG